MMLSNLILRKRRSFIVHSWFVWHFSSFIIRIILLRSRSVWIYWTVNIKAYIAWWFVQFLIMEMLFNWSVRRVSMNDCMPLRIRFISLASVKTRSAHRKGLSLLKSTTILTDIGYLFLDFYQLLFETAGFFLLITIRLSWGGRICSAYSFTALQFAHRFSLPFEDDTSREDYFCVVYLIDCFLLVKFACPLRNQFAHLGHRDATAFSVSQGSRGFASGHWQLQLVIHLCILHRDRIQPLWY